jgi:hypothetical protein
VSSQANEICDKEARKTIAPEHIVSALKVDGLFASGGVPGLTKPSKSNLGLKTTSRKLRVF